MKVLTLLPLAFVASALIIPDAETLDTLQVQDQKSHPFWDNIKDPAKVWEELEDKFKEAAGRAKDKFEHAAHHAHDVAVQYSDDFQSAFAGQAWLDSAQQDEMAPPPPHHRGPQGRPFKEHRPHDGPPPPGKHSKDHPPHDGPPHDGPPHHGPPHHGPPCHGGPHHGPHHKFSNKTVLEVLASSKHFSKFVKVVSEYPDLVELLNGTTANFTVFAPTNRAFEKIPKDAPKPPKEFLKSLLTYHISTDFYPAGRILVSRTIPSALEAPFIGGQPQRLSTQIGLFGITVNFYASIVAADIFGTNGVVHGLDSFLLPPPKVVDILGFLPTVFSTLVLGLEKSELYDLFNDTSLHVGGTLFAPDNFAFSLLGPGINAFLFSPPGQKYLQALLLYHAAPDVTLYSDAIYKAEEDKSDIPKDFYHIELPTGLEGKPLSIDTLRFGRLVTMKINGYILPTALDGVAADGVIHTLSVVLIPPRQAGDSAEVATSAMSLEEFKERLEPYLEAGDKFANDRIDGKDGIWDELK